MADEQHSRHHADGSVRTVLAGDLGGSGLRLALIDAAGRTLAGCTVPTAVQTGAPGQSEADPQDWWHATAAAAATLAREAPTAFAGVQAIAVSAMTRSQVLLDSAGAPLRPAILWADSRSAATLPGLRALLPDDHPETPQVNAFHPLARLWWLARLDQPGPPAWVVEPKDYLNYRLTGRIAGDAVSMARLLAAARPGPGGSSLLQAAGIDPGILPVPATPGQRLGTVLPGLDGALAALAGIPVVAMANDTWASVLGLGALRPGMAYNLTGTSEVLGILDHAAPVAEGLLTVAWGEALTQLGGPCQAGGDTLAWLLSLLSRDKGDAPATMAAALRDAAPLVFLPYLQGERTPYWDPDLRGAFIGLSRRHGATDLIVAVMEGVAFLNRIVLERATQAAGRPVTELRHGGGGSANPVWCQIKADILGCDVVVPEGDEPGVAGAAMVAWTALGDFASLSAAQDALARTGRRYRPDPARRAHYNRLFAVFRDAEAALRPLSHRLAAWTGQAA